MNKFIKNVALYVLLIVIVVSMFNTFMAPQQQRSEITYSDFVTQVDNKNVQSVVMSENAVTGKLKDGTEFSSYLPNDNEALIEQDDRQQCFCYGKTAGTAVLVDGSAFFCASNHHPRWCMVLDHEPDTGRRRKSYELWQIPCQDDRGGPCQCFF